MALCQVQGCKTFGTYGHVDSSARWCKRHATDDMVNKTITMCNYPGCKKKATYGIRGSSMQTNCAAHRQPWQSDTVSKRCDEEGCTTHPSFGPGGKRRRCAAHALPGDKHWKSGKASRSSRKSTKPSRPPRKKTSPSPSSHKDGDDVSVTILEWTACYQGACYQAACYQGACYPSSETIHEVPPLDSSCETTTYDPFDLVDYPWVRTSSLLYDVF